MGKTRHIGIGLTVGFLWVVTGGSSAHAHDQMVEATVLTCHDADTCEVSIDLNFGLSLKETIRLFRINAWEVTGRERPKGLRARDWLNGQIAGKAVLLKLPERLRDKYGRILADVYLKGQCLNDRLVTEGYAHYQKY